MRLWSHHVSSFLRPPLTLLCRHRYLPHLNSFYQDLVSLDPSRYPPFFWGSPTPSLQTFERARMVQFFLPSFQNMNRLVPPFQYPFFLDPFLFPLDCSLSQTTVFLFMSPPFRLSLFFPTKLSSPPLLLPRGVRSQHCSLQFTLFLPISI